MDLSWNTLDTPLSDASMETINSLGFKTMTPVQVNYLDIITPES